VTTRFRGPLMYTKSFFRNLMVKKFCKSVHNCQSYDKTLNVLFLWLTVHITVINVTLLWDPI